VISLCFHLTNGAASIFSAAFGRGGGRFGGHGALRQFVVMSASASAMGASTGAVGAAAA